MLSARDFHSSVAMDNVTLAAAGVGIATAAMAARYALVAYQRSKAASLPTQPSEIKADGSSSSSSQSGASSGAGSATASTGGFFGAQAMARRFYRGGFEDKMTRREAALILGVR